MKRKITTYLLSFGIGLVVGVGGHALYTSSGKRTDEIPYRQSLRYTTGVRVPDEAGWAKPLEESSEIEEKSEETLPKAPVIKEADPKKHGITDFINLSEDVARLLPDDFLNLEEKVSDEDIYTIVSGDKGITLEQFVARELARNYLGFIPDDSPSFSYELEMNILCETNQSKEEQSKRVSGYIIWLDRVVNGLSNDQKEKIRDITSEHIEGASQIYFEPLPRFSVKHNPDSRIINKHVPLQLLYDWKNESTEQLLNDEQWARFRLYTARVNVYHPASLNNIERQIKSAEEELGQSEELNMFNEWLKQKRELFKK